MDALDEEEKTEDAESLKDLESFDSVKADIGHIIQVYPKRTNNVDAAENSTVKERLVYSETGVYEDKIINKKINGQWRRVLDRITIFKGYLVIENEIRVSISQDEKTIWAIKFDEQSFTGSLSEIVELITHQGKSVVHPTILTSVLSRIISESKIPVHRAAPAIGYYQKDGIINLSDSANNVFPTTDAQRKYFETYQHKLSRYDPEKTKEVIESTAKFIDALPEKTKQAALIARGYATIAPIGYILKGTILRVFPYLYLYGQAGSSKTHIACASAVYSYGDMEELSGEAIESAFRLGMEFGATTFPRVADEAHDVFAKNLSIFKAAATSQVATKRGNKDKSINEYPALSSFIFTSNIPPIEPEDDPQGAVMDRILVAECVSGEGFKKEQYTQSHSILLRDGFVYSCEVAKILNGKKIEDVVVNIERHANIFASRYGITRLRRAYCLGAIVEGIGIYLDILSKNGVAFPLTEMDIYKIVYDSIEGATEKVEPVLDFVGWVRASLASPSSIYQNKGLFQSADGGVLISRMALIAYKEQFKYKAKPFQTLSALYSELSRKGFNVEKPTTNSYKNYDNIESKAWDTIHSIKLFITI